MVVLYLKYIPKWSTLTTTTAKTLDQVALAYLAETCRAVSSLIAWFSYVLQQTEFSNWQQKWHPLGGYYTCDYKSHITSLFKTSNYKQNHTHYCGLYNLVSALLWPYFLALSPLYKMCPECWFSVYPSNTPLTSFRGPYTCSSYCHYLDFCSMTIPRKVTTNFSNSFYFLQIIYRYGLIVIPLTQNVF